MKDTKLALSGLKGDLSALEEILAAFMKMYPEGMFVIDKNGIVVLSSEVLAKRFGVKVDELLGRSIYNFLPPDIAESRKQKIDQVFETKAPLTFVDSREDRIYESYLYPITDREGVAKYVAVIAVDITEKAKTLEALQFERSQLLSIFNSIDEVIYVSDPISYEILFMNRYLKDLFGKDLTGKICYREFQGLNHPCEFCTNPIILQNKGEPYKWEYRNPILNRDYFIVDRIIKWPDGRDVRLEIALDITNVKELQRSISDKEEKYRNLFHKSPVGYRELDKEGHTIDVNQTELEMLGYDKNELVGKFIWESAVDENLYKEIFLAYLAGTKGNEGNFEIEYKRKDGTTFPALVNVVVLKDQEGKVKGVRTALLDITELTKMREQKAALEKQLLESQKMEAIGRLAGGIAHDFNNMLTIIKGMCQLSLLKLSKDDPIYEKLKQIETTADKAAELTKQLLAFSRKQVMEMKRLSLNKIIRSMEAMLRRVIGENIELITILDPSLCMIKADESQITQVILNLVVNAKDAMPKGGKIIIETKNVEIGKAEMERHVDAQCGGYVLLGISDTGIGIPKDVLPHIFEPFFTTKESGKGTGLGLSTVYGIVKQSGGNIYVYSEVGKGTTFKIYLPAVDRLAYTTVVEEKSSSQRGAETILIVEDDETVREVVVALLSELGYKVLDASNKTEAEFIAKNTDEPIHLILTDVLLKDTDGLEVSESLKKIHPNAKVLFMSGYTENVITLHGVLMEGIEFIQKPFNLNTLAEKVRDVLDKDKA